MENEEAWIAPYYAGDYLTMVEENPDLRFFRPEDQGYNIFVDGICIPTCAKEKEAATALIQDGCVLISQHADSEGAPKACEENNVPNVAYNISTISIAPNTALISSAISWKPYMKHIIECAINGTEIETDYTMTLKDGGVILTELNPACAAEGTEEAIEAAKAKLESGELHVFDTAAFTVGGQTLTSYKADVDTDADFTPDTEAISDGYFHESEYRAAPYFDLDIDGITTK